MSLTERYFPKGSVREKLLTTSKKVTAKLLVEAIVGILASDIKVDGQENLQRIKEYLAEGRTVFVMPNHQSHLDGPIVGKVLKKTGIERFKYVLGMKIIKHILQGFLANAADYYLVWPQDLLPKNREGKKQRWDINKETARAIKHDREKRGSLIVVFPEGTRSRSGYLGKGLSEITGYLDDKSVIIPVAVLLTDRRMPVNSANFTRGPVVVRFGGPVEAKSLFEKYSDLDRSEQRERVMGEIMGRIAELLPRRYLKSDRIAEN